MAVYTQLDRSDFEAIGRAFSLGEHREARLVPQGSINTNALITTSTGRYFVRHTTVRSREDLDFEAALCDHLAESRFPAPKMHRAQSGRPYIALKNGLACVFGYLAGEELTRAALTPEHCEQLGAELGKLHRITNAFPSSRENPYGPAEVRSWLTELELERDPEVRAIAAELLALLEEPQHEKGLVPRGVVHADLFMDNVKWVGDRVSAFFDFEMACVERYTLDLAIALNAWCFDLPQGGYQTGLLRALIRGYQSERPLSPEERADLHAAALFGAIRYTASRIRDFHLSPLPPEKLFKKDFRTYLGRVRELTRMGRDGFLQLLKL